MVKVLRPFHDGPSRRYVRPGDEIDPTPTRHDELAINGLVEPRLEGAKAAAPPENKMLEPPANKAVVTVPRRPGRPPKVRL